MKAFFQDFLTQIGEDPNREELRNTPQRAADAFSFLTQGYKTTLSDILQDALYPSDRSDLVVVNDIEVFSLCEHHLLPFFGRCHVGYIPNGQVIGLSKIARIVDLFARRLQIQERLTANIAEAIQEATGALGVGVFMEANHLCMQMIGVEKQHPVVKTTTLLGSIKDDPEAKQSFFSMV